MTSEKLENKQNGATTALGAMKTPNTLPCISFIKRKSTFYKRVTSLCNKPKI